MRTAIIGFASSGKSDFYTALVGSDIAKISSRAIIKVPESRLKSLITIYHPKKIIYAEIEYIDISNNSKFGSLDAQTLNAVQSANCLLVVLDNFSGLTDPKAQQTAIENCLMLNDLTIVEKRLERIKLNKYKSSNTLYSKEEEILQVIRDMLEANHPIRNNLNLIDYLSLRSFNFLSAKPILYAWNCKESYLATFTTPTDALNTAHIKITARLERELNELYDLVERELFLTDLGLTVSILNRCITKTYALLGLITFFTVGDKEIRAWAISQGITAPEAAGIIHSDIQRGFIRAEVLSCHDLLSVGSYQKAKTLGLVKLEGKNYVVADGDIIKFRFNV